MLRGAIHVGGAIHAGCAIHVGGAIHAVGNPCWGAQSMGILHADAGDTFYARGANHPCSGTIMPS